MESSKSFINRVTACLCAALICICLVVFSFLVPVHSKAESVADQYEDWLDSHLFEGSSFWIDEIVQTATGLIPGGAAVYLGIVGGLNMVEVHNANTISVSDISTLQGYYYYGGAKYLCQTAVLNGPLSVSDGGLPMADSAHFHVRNVFGRTDGIQYARLNTSQYGNSSYQAYKISGVSPNGSPSTTYYWSVSGGGNIFPNVDKLNQTSTYAGVNVSYSLTTPTNLSDNVNTESYIHPGSNSGYDIAGGFKAGTKVSFQDHGFTGTFNLDENGNIPIQDITDFITEDLNVYILQEYPDIDPDILFVPVVVPEEETGGSGCNCVHNIYVDVTCYFDPEINVYVTEYITIENNIDIELPSDWVQDYTLTTDPYEVETIPFPTQENSEPVTMPTLDVEDYEDAYGNAIDFWFYVAQSFIEKLHLQLLLAFAFALSVAGFVLWKLGGGGKE